MSTFDSTIRAAANAACTEWSYTPPPEVWYSELYKRLPPGLCDVFARGLQDGLLTMTDGYRFTMRDLPAGKGPYALFSRSSKRSPAPNWEYVVQAVDYVQAHELLAPKGYRIGVEDHLMDVTVRSDTGLLLWYIESKEKPEELRTLFDSIRDWGERGVDFDVDDRHNDGLRKAKYLCAHRPPYFSGSAIGLRLDFSVTYYDEDQFVLRADSIPIG